MQISAGVHQCVACPRGWLCREYSPKGIMLNHTYTHIYCISKQLQLHCPLLAIPLLPTPYNRSHFTKFTGFTGLFSAVLQNSNPAARCRGSSALKERCIPPFYWVSRQNKWILVYHTTKRCRSELQSKLALKEYSLCIFVSCHAPVLTPNIRTIKNSTHWCSPCPVGFSLRLRQV